VRSGSSAVGDVAADAEVDFLRERRESSLGNGFDAGYIDHVKYCAVILFYRNFQRPPALGRTGTPWKNGAEKHERLSQVETVQGGAETAAVSPLVLLLVGGKRSSNAVTWSAPRDGG